MTARTFCTVAVFLRLSTSLPCPNGVLSRIDLRQEIRLYAERRNACFWQMARVVPDALREQIVSRDIIFNQPRWNGDRKNDISFRTSSRRHDRAFSGGEVLMRPLHLPSRFYKQLRLAHDSPKQYPDETGTAPSANCYRWQVLPMMLFSFKNYGRIRRRMAQLMKILVAACCWRICVCW